MRSAFFYYYLPDSDKFVYCLDIPELFDVTEDEIDNLRYELLEILEHCGMSLKIMDKNNGRI